MIKVLNLYAGIGGNRKLWTDVEVTAVELNPKIAKIYQDFFPEDTVIVADAHQYLLDYYKEFDFIWSSPPCPSHSKLNRTNQYKNIGIKLNYPDMVLYQEIILLQNWFDGKYCIENVIAYYNPLIKPIETGGHYYWTNFRIKEFKLTRGIGYKGTDRINKRAKKLGINVDKYNLKSAFKEKIINNCVEPEVGLHILNQALERLEARNEKQLNLDFADII